MTRPRRASSRPEEIQDQLFGEPEAWFELPADVPVSSIFIDESGSKHSRGGFFVVGFLKVRDSAKLDREVRHLRQAHKMFSEAKFGMVNRDNLRFYFDLIEMVADADVRVGGSVYDSTLSFRGTRQTWETQAVMSARLVKANINKGELVNVFLDLVQTPKGQTFATKVRADVNRGIGERCVLGCYDVDSKSMNLLQVADVVAGAIAYERRQWAGDTPDGPLSEDSPKAKVSARFRRALGLESFADIRQGKVNILTMRNS